MSRSVNHVELVIRDITKAKFDAIVNAANQAMLGGGVDGAIHKAAGPKLLEYCERSPAVDGIRCPTGEARITPAGSLQAKFVIHMVGPVYGVDPDPESLLAKAYQASLDLAIENGCQSVALPALSCGAYAFPWRKAATIAFSTCAQLKFQKLSLMFCLSGSEIMDIWSHALTEFIASHSES